MFIAVICHFTAETSQSNPFPLSIIACYYVLLYYVCYTDDSPRYLGLFIILNGTADINPTQQLRESAASCLTDCKTASFCPLVFAVSGQVTVKRKWAVPNTCWPDLSTPISNRRLRPGVAFETEQIKTCHCCSHLTCD